MMTGRLIIAIFTTLFEEAILVALVLWGLPQLGIHIPLYALIAIMVILAFNAAFFYAIGSRALRRRPFAGLGSTVGSKGKVVRPLDPYGIIRIGDELWEARADKDIIEIGEEVIVSEQDGLKLMVTRAPVPKETRK